MAHTLCTCLLVLSFISCSAFAADATSWPEVKLAVEQTVAYPARQKSQLYAGQYDKRSHKTYLVYPAGFKQGLSACEPHIIAFDHKTAQWSQAHKISSVLSVPDSHNYPQLIIDELGYLHVFHSSHAKHRILYARSQRPGDMSAWDVQTLAGTETATYGAAFKARTGAMHLCFRERIGKANYEPASMLSSYDGGKSWQKRRLIDPAPIVDDWGTVYVKAIHYHQGDAYHPEGLQITFGVHQHHNICTNKHYYVFFRFEDERFVSVSGRDLGPVLNKAVYEKHCFLFGYAKRQRFFNTKMACHFDEGRAVVFYNKKVNNQQYLHVSIWSAVKNEWHAKNLHMKNMMPNELEKNKQWFSLYCIEGGRKVQVLLFHDQQLKQRKLLFEIPQDAFRIRHLCFIKDAHSAFKGCFYRGERHEWKAPPANGKIYTFVDQQP